MADHNIQSARNAVRSGNWDAAQNHAGSVLVIRPGDLEAMRIRFEAFRELEHPQLLSAAYGLFTNPQGNETL